MLAVQIDQPAALAATLASRQEPIPSLVHLFSNGKFETASDLWYFIRDRFVGTTPLGQRMRTLASDERLSENYEQLGVKQHLVTIFSSKEFRREVHFISRILNKLQPDQLNDVLSTLFDGCPINKSEKLIKKIRGLVTLEKIEASVKSQFHHFQSTWGDVQAYANMSKHELEAERLEKVNSIKRTAYHYAISIMDHLVNLMMLVFHLKNNTIDEGDPLTAEMQAHMQYTALIQNISLISGWLVALSLWLGNVLMTAAITGFSVLVGGIVAYIYFNYIKPCPENLSPFRNLVTEAVKGELPAVGGRDKEIQEVIDYLCSNESNTRQHPLLVGTTGVGKTQILHGLAKRIAEGNVPDALKGKKLFMVNTTDLANGGAWGKMWNLEKMLHNIRGYESEAIFFFDELHIAFYKNNRDLGQKLKTLMDPGPGALKFCVGATTTKEYDSYMAQDEAFNRRSHKTEVLPMDPAETKVAMAQIISNNLEQVIVEQGVLQLLSQLTVNPDYPAFTEASQPFTSSMIFSTALARANRPLKTREHDEYTVAAQKRQSLYNEAQSAEGIAALPSSREGYDREVERKELDAQIRTLKRKLDEQENQLKNFKGLIKKRYQIKRSSAFEAVKLQQNLPQAVASESRALTGQEHEIYTNSERDNLEKFLLENHYFRLSLDRRIQAESAKFGAHPPAIITTRMVHEIIAEEHHKRQEKLEAPPSPKVSAKPLRKPVLRYLKPR